MANNQIFSIEDGNTLELHYWFKDNTHTMDAFIQNRCELEVLNIIKEIASHFGSEYIIEIEPSAEGGFRNFLKLVKKDKSALATGLVLGIATTLIFTPLTKVIEKGIDKIFEDSKYIELQRKNLMLDNEGKELDNDGKRLINEGIRLDNENKKLLNQKLKDELSVKADTLVNSNKIKRHRSNFYETLEKYPKVEKVSFMVEDDNKVKMQDEKIVLRKQFKEFILVNDSLPADGDENAIIEIISPVLKKGKHKWSGLYKGEPIFFEMKSKEFQTLVQTGKVNFKNGSSINCHLKIKKKINNEGIESITGYEVLLVSSYFENDQPVLTYEGKRHKQKKATDGNQMAMF